jgi:hypothetical protein
MSPGSRSGVTSAELMQVISRKIAALATAD